MSDGASREGQSTLRRLRHEMRTSLGQILGYSEMLHEDAEDRGLEDMLPDLARIRNAAKKLLEMVDQIFRTGKSAEPRETPGETGTHPDSKALAAEETMPGLAKVTAGGSILVVDDDPDNRDLLARRLEKLGHRICCAESGEQALGMVSDQEFDVVLLDVMMPGMDGFEVLRRIRKNRSVSELPVIMATALQSSEDTVAALKCGANDYVVKPFDIPVVMARVANQLVLKRAVLEVENLARELQIRNAFIRRTLGRYVSDEIATDLLENPESFEAKGEKRRVTILMTDLRGFSTLTENLTPVDVVRILNHYLETMAEVIQSHGGTIDEFIGDAILALFGAPIRRDDDPERAVSCGLAMQLAMASVNAKNAKLGLPSVEMGIGIATGDVIVGTIGSEKRAKYSAVGSAVNLTARVESQTLGGEVLICPATHEAVSSLKIAETRQIRAKGFEGAIPIYRITGFEGRSDLDLPEDSDSPVELAETLPARVGKLEGKTEGDEAWPGTIVALSRSVAVLDCPARLARLSTVRLDLLNPDGTPLPGVSYARVVSDLDAVGSMRLRFTARSPALQKLLDERLGDQS